MRNVMRYGTFAILAGLICFSASLAQAAETAETPKAAEAEKAEKETGFDRTWKLATLYEDKEGIIQKLSLVGRAQIDSAWTHPDANDAAGNGLANYDSTHWRRFRFGAAIQMFDDWKIHAEANFDLNAEVRDWYTQLTDTYIQWKVADELKIKLFKQSAGFTLDGKTSSKRLLTLERNNLSNNLWFTAEYFNGILASGKVADDFSYKASFFSNAGDPELAWKGASWFVFFELGYEFDETASLHLDFVHQDEHEDANTRPFGQVVSLIPKWQSGAFGVWGDISFGKGFDDQGQGDVWGIHIKPFYDITDNVQVVLAVTHVEGDGDNSVRLNRYDNKVALVDDKGDRVADIYAGVNVYFYGHKFKWQTGITYTKMDDGSVGGIDYKGWTLSTGFRVYW